MSGDRRLPSLLAITENGNLYPNDTIDNPGLSIFFEGLAELYFTEADDKETPEETDQEGSEEDPDPVDFSVRSTYYSYGEWKNIVYHQNGLCRVKWGQRYPYNKYCPRKKEDYTLTGCVATAVAQLMSVYQYPQTYNGYTYSWSNMLSPWDITGQDDVAILMQQLGLPKNLDVDYGVDASSASHENIPRTLKSFGYSQPGVCRDYDTSAVVDELKEGYGIIIRGDAIKKVSNFLGIKTTRYSEGHCWLGHGVLERKREVRLMSVHSGLLSTWHESEWYILCNFGWLGSHDGYYLSRVFDTSRPNPDFPDYESGTRSVDSSDEQSGVSGYFQYRLRTVTGIRK